jgi:hypothetical protein
LGTDYGSHDIEVSIHELSDVVPAMVLMCAEHC